MASSYHIEQLSSISSSSKSLFFDNFFFHLKMFYLVSARFCSLSFEIFRIFIVHSLFVYSPLCFDFIYL